MLNTRKSSINDFRPFLIIKIFQFILMFFLIRISNLLENKHGYMKTHFTGYLQGTVFTIELFFKIVTNILFGVCIIFKYTFTIKKDIL